MTQWQDQDQADEREAEAAEARQWTERELPDEADMDDDDEPDRIPCPNCGKRIFEDAELCPHCRQYVSREDASVQRSSRTTAIIVVLLILSLAGLLIYLR